MSASPQHAIEVDPQLVDGNTSDYASSGYDTDSTSLSSTVREYILENGRRYQTYFGVDKNLLPTDEEESDRMDIHHEALLQLLDGKLHTGPIVDNPQRILDVGTGTGLWAIDMADKYPSAIVTGIDLSPCQPNWVPPNCKFEVDDAELDWTFKDNEFDFIQFRNVSQGIAKWDKVLKEAYRCLKPGGVVELAEAGLIFYSDDGTLADDNPMKRWSTLIGEAMDKVGRPAIYNVETLADRLSCAGFEDIKSYNPKQPFGPWPKEKRLKKLGCMLILTCDSGFHAYGMAVLCRTLGWSAEDAQKLCDDGVKAVRNPKTHAYTHHYISHGRKPLEKCD